MTPGKRPSRRSAHRASAQQQLAEALSRLKPTERDLAVLRQCLIDFIAAVIVGYRVPVGRRVVMRYAGDGPRGLAFVLSYLAELAEFSHGHSQSAGHIGSTPLPTVLSLAAADSRTDRAWSRAALAGYEAFGCVGRSLMPELEAWGSGSTGFSGTLGAAAAAAILLGMDAVGLSSALGLAAYLTPLTAMDAALSAANSLEAAQATSTGMLAAELSLTGIDGPTRLLDDLHCRVKGTAAPTAFGSDPVRPTIHSVYFKPFPSCRFTHGAIEAVLGLVRNGVSPEDIRSIAIRTTPAAMKWCGESLRGVPPPTVVRRQYSIPYLVGLAVLEGAITIEGVFTPAPKLEHAIVSFASDKVMVRADPDLVRHGTICPAVVRLSSRDGALTERAVTNPWGCPAAPMKLSDTLEKFTSVATAALGPTTAARWAERALALDWRAIARAVCRYVTRSSLKPRPQFSSFEKRK